jgi:hypothetical protein
LVNVFMQRDSLERKRMSLLVSTGSVCFFVVEVLDMADYRHLTNNYCFKHFLPHSPTN